MPLQVFSDREAYPVYPIDPVTLLPTGGAEVLSASASAGTGMTNAKVKSAATVNSTLLKGAAAKLYSYFFANNTAVVKFVKFYSKATAPTVGTDIPIFTVIIPANGIATWSNAIGKAVALGLGYGITNGIAESDATAVAVDDVVGHIDYA